MIIASYDLSELEHKQVLLPHQRLGLQYTRSGYGSRIPTTHMVKLPQGKRWRRVYCCVWSNAGTCYVSVGKDWIVIR